MTTLTFTIRWEDREHNFINWLWMGRWPWHQSDVWQTTFGGDYAVTFAWTLGNLPLSNIGLRLVRKWTVNRPRMFRFELVKFFYALWNVWTWSNHTGNLECFTSWVFYHMNNWSVLNRTIKMQIRFSEDLWPIVSNTSSILSCLILYLYHVISNLKTTKS